MTDQYIPMVEMADGTTYYLKVERLFPSNTASEPNPKETER